MKKNALFFCLALVGGLFFSTAQAATFTQPVRFETDIKHPGLVRVSYIVLKKNNDQLLDHCQYNAQIGEKPLKVDSDNYIRIDKMLLVGRSRAVQFNSCFNYDKLPTKITLRLYDDGISGSCVVSK